MSVPRKMSYVDCNIKDQGNIEISWGWPVVLNDGQSDAPNEDVQSIPVTHAVIQYIDGNEMTTVTAETSPYIFTGSAPTYDNHIRL